MNRSTTLNTIEHYGSSPSKEAASLCSGVAVLDVHHLTVASFNSSTNEFQEYFVFDVPENTSSLKELMNKLQLKKLYVAVQNNQFTVVPTGVITPENNTEYLNFILGEKRNQKESSMVINNLTANLLYRIDQSVFKDLTKNGITVLHPAGSALAYHSVFNDDKAHHAVFLHIFDEAFHIYFFKNGLYHSNSFKITSDADIAYYTLYSMEQLEISVEDTPVHYTVQTSKQLNQLDSLKNYLPKLAPIELDTSFELNKDLQETLPNGVGITLLSTLLCE
ncbi:DUF3822 family protein [Salibacter halophilus]|uniref:DUF3822 family protein n=1 Tax=Salibacter halophilus TaxID=1803916 RepID=A0A6N6MAA1_9FLAO|nr:DUF3822 family protein [Salibacter halophilus]KAB1066172.1 DUF3822 family protein [Salibacter halophilus]